MNIIWSCHAGHSRLESSRPKQDSSLWRVHVQPHIDTCTLYIRTARDLSAFVASFTIMILPNVIIYKFWRLFLAPCQNISDRRCCGSHNKFGDDQCTWFVIKYAINTSCPIKYACMKKCNLLQCYIVTKMWHIYILYSSSYNVKTTLSLNVNLFSYERRVSRKLKLLSQYRGPFRSRVHIPRVIFFPEWLA